MDEQATKKPYRYSVQLQFAAYFFLLTVVLLALLNTYPLRASRDVVFSEKESALMSRASVLSSSLSLMETLTEDNTRQVLSLLDTTGLERVLVTDPEGAPLYDTSEDDAAAPAEVKTALKGKAAFRSKFDMTAFDSGAAVPVRNNGRTIGTVYILEHDADQAELIVSIQHRLGTISLAAALLALVIIFFSIRMMTRRITMLADGVRTVQSGDYSFRLKLTGNDELTELGSELNHLTERLETTEAERRRFVSDASHELKTPLASIRLLSDSIVQSEGMDAATMREFVTDIGAEAERLQRTTEKLLNLSRRDDGVQGELQDVDLKAAVDGTHRLLEPLAQASRVTVETDLAEGCVVRATEDDIYHIVFNLVENAIKYNLPMGKVLVTVRREGGRCRLVVEDTGIGIPEADRPNVFTRFYRVDKARSREHGGSGLGLSIVHDAVKLYGGEIALEGVEPHGTRFTVDATSPNEWGRQVMRQSTWLPLRGSWQPEGLTEGVH